MSLTHPSELEWNEGPLPDVRSVPYDCSVLVWLVSDYTEENRQMWDSPVFWIGGKIEPEKHHGNLCGIHTVRPYGDTLNRVRWCDSNCYPLSGCVKVTFWAWVHKGTPGAECPHKCIYDRDEPVSSTDDKNG